MIGVLKRIIWRRPKPLVRKGGIIKIVSDMVGVRQDIAELSDKIKERTRKLDLLISELIDEMKHKGILETRRVK